MAAVQCITPYLDPAEACKKSCSVPPQPPFGPCSILLTLSASTVHRLISQFILRGSSLDPH
eukprot:15438647-Alexandrium_andersonii.AAC.1